MNNIIHFETFLLSSILMNLTPGNDTIFILTRSIGQGKKAGIISALGIGAGCLVHTFLAAFGLSVVIAQSVFLFNLIKYAGAAYLFYMGYKMLVDSNQLNMNGVNHSESINYKKIFQDGMITNMLNPKVALFFIAFLPQFINPNAKQTVLSFLALGFTFITTGTIWCLILAIFAATIFSKLKNNQKISNYIHKICGLTFIGLGVKVANT